MRVTVLYFAVFKERLGRSEDALELPAGSRVHDAVALLSDRHPAIAALRGKFRVAVNQEFADDDLVLGDGDELALIPPVAGGADRVFHRPDRYVALLDAPLSLDRVVAAVGGPGMGGI